MNDPHPDDGLGAARRARDALRERLTRQQTERTAAERSLAEARSRFGDDDRRTESLRAQVEEAGRSLGEAEEAYAAAKERVHGALGARVDRDIGDDFAALETSLPLVLLPVRLETRFATGGDARELWIRVYPDEIHADAHEHELTDEEVEAGRAYWLGVLEDPSAARTAWKLLLETVPWPRAAWVVRTMSPIRDEDGEGDGDEREPGLPDPPRKEGAWTRAAEARLLPDRWIALGFRGGSEVARVVGAAIVEPLAVTLAPDAPAAQTVDLTGDGLEIDEAVRWTVDFERAVEVGMGLRMPLNADTAATGFDELVVLGVKGSLPPQDAAAELAALFDEHHYGRGMAFLRQGTPTNNTEAAPSGYPPADLHGEHSFAIELDETRTIAGRDGERFARALGIPPETVLHIERSDADEQTGARAMCGALWPATWGYFFEELLFVDDLDDEVDRFRDYFIEHVRARGHHPAFRIGGTPYGVLVTSSLSRWRNRGRRGLLQNAMPEDLRRLREIWRGAAAGAPRVGRTADADRDLLEVLEMDASAREVRVRSTMGPNASINIGAFFGLNWDPVRAKQLELANVLAQRLGRTDVSSRIFGLTFGKSAWTFAAGLVVPPPQAGSPQPPSETEQLPFNYIRWLREAPTIEDVREQRLPEGVTPPNTLLYLLLRHSMLREAARTADRVLIKENILTHAVTRDRELVAASFATPGPTSGAPGVAAAAVEPTATVWERMQTAVPNVTGNLSLAEWVWAEPVAVETRRLREYREHLRVLEDLPIAELGRLLTETLDVCSHRLDAWMTSLYMDRLNELRSERAASVVGGFGWVIDLRPKPVDTIPVPLPPLTDLVRRRIGPAIATLPQQTSTGGFIHAPSMTHAATAAVLRNGYLSRRGQNDQRYGIDVSSRRVRRARWILDAVRNGQSLGAVLGYQFERGLHEGHRPLQLDRYKEPFRRAYPLVASKLTPTDATDDEAVEGVGARNVVDGLALHAAWRADAIAWGEDGKPPRPGAHFDAVDAELRALDETMDAVADLLMSESVFQLVRGNTAGASASLDALARGVRAPDPEVIRTPRGGSALTHRVALVLGGDPLSPVGWAGIPASPRSAAEPHLDGWIGALIGDPAKVRCAATYTDDAPVPAAHTVEVTLAQLRLRPVDVLHCVTAAEAGERRGEAQPTTTAQSSELDARIAAVVLARADADPLGEVRIAYAPTDRANTRSFPEIAELLGTVQAVLSTARALEPKDLLASAQHDQLGSADVDEAGLAARANTAIGALTGARDAVVAAASPLAVQPTPVNTDRTALVAALRAAALFGVPGAFTGVPHTDVAAGAEAEAAQQARTRDLVARATNVATELTRRLEAATAEPSPRAKPGHVFGEAFRALVRFTPATAALAQPLAQGPTPTPSAAQVREWLRGAALVRPPLGRHHRLTMLQRALGGAPAALTVTQVPHLPGAAWVALPFADEESRPPSGALGLALFAANGPLPDAASRWTGLLLDEWTELIPNREEATAVAIHYDDPGAEAPHCVLIAVPPDDAARWTLDTAVDVVRETLELARLRCVDGDLLGVLSPLLPATYLAANSRFDTIAVKFEGTVVRDPVIVQAGGA